MDIKSVVENNPYTFYFKIRDRWPSFFQSVKKKKGDTFSEKLYREVHGNEEASCEVCGDLCNFQTFTEGFNDFCSRSCLGERKSNEATEVRTCPVCEEEFEALRCEEKKLCSLSCRDQWLARDEVVEKRVRKTKETVKENHGNENYRNQEKARQTKKKRYGDENYNNTEKFKKTCKEKYGGVGSGSKEIKEKAEKTTQEKYGYKQISKTKHYREKSKESVFERFYNKLFESNRLEGKVEPLFGLSEYEGTDYQNKYPFRCLECGNEFKDHLYSGNVPRCRECNPTGCRSSNKENEVFEFVQKCVDGEVRQNVNGVIDGELDIFIPFQNLAIEFDGLYWHSEEGGKYEKNYHLKKTQACEEKGIHLIHIFEDEWETQEIKQKIKEILENGKLSSKEKVVLDRRWYSVLNVDRDYETGKPKPWYLGKNYTRRSEQKKTENDDRIWDCGYIVLNEKTN